jgi:ABC-type transport system involved in cytochrome bd biosynthesis fused ATPase/permease subunit
MKTLWFKCKSYGWGWTPATWQGWAITIAYTVILIVCVLSVDWNNEKEIMLMFVLPLIIVTTAFVGIAYRTGEKPRWQWGSREKSNNDL